MYNTNTLIYPAEESLLLPTRREGVLTFRRGLRVGMGDWDLGGDGYCRLQGGREREF
jgi:hypothetical protein